MATVVNDKRITPNFKYHQRHEIYLSLGFL